MVAWLDLPAEVWSTVCKKLSTDDLLPLMATCHQLNTIISNDDSIWKAHCCEYKRTKHVWQTLDTLSAIDEYLHSVGQDRLEDLTWKHAYQRVMQNLRNNTLTMAQLTRNRWTFCFKHQSSVALELSTFRANNTYVSTFFHQEPIRYALHHTGETLQVHHYPRLYTGRDEDGQWQLENGFVLFRQLAPRDEAAASTPEALDKLKTAMQMQWPNGAGAVEEG
eukprot:m.21848 g.21848  ORF g.21848 m.21848 type:complete len:221 (-) comp11169_c0_seq2:1300-1962(-)